MPPHCDFVKMCTLTLCDLYVLRRIFVSEFLFYHIFSLCVHYHHYPSLQIVIEYPQLLLHTFSKLYWILSFTCNPVTYKQAATLCVLQSTSYSFASTISTCCSHGLGTMNATLLPTIYHVSIGAPSFQFVYRIR